MELERERVAHAATRSTAAMLGERLAAADKEVFKLERQLEEKAAAFDAFQAISRRQIRELEAALRESRAEGGGGGA